MTILPGDKGSLNGDPYTNSYYGAGNGGQEADGD
jgi:hypothetical protein